MSQVILYSTGATRCDTARISLGRVEKVSEAQSMEDVDHAGNLGDREMAVACSEQKTRKLCRSQARHGSTSPCWTTALLADGRVVDKGLELLLRVCQIEDTL